VGGTVAAILVFRGPEAAQEDQSQATEPVGTQTQSTSEFTPFDEALLPYVPDGIRSGCRHVKPLTDNFDASISCRAGGPVTSLTYSHARSGQYLFEFMRQRRDKVGLPEAARAGLCSAGVVPSLNYTVAMGFRGRAESVETPVREAVLGSILCAQIREQARIDWLTQEPAIFATARGNDLAALYQWWTTDAGPEP
jgi:hypothetical protein